MNKITTAVLAIPIAIAFTALGLLAVGMATVSLIVQTIKGILS